MATPLLAAKLSLPPLPAALVDRGRLAVRLSSSDAHLLLIVAPAGFGKTTLVASWLSNGMKGEGGMMSIIPPSSFMLQPFHTAWLSLDPRDNDPTRFWVALVAALARTFSGLGDHARSMLQSPQPPAMDVVIGALLDDLAVLPVLCLLVLDDYHLITEPSIHTGLALLIEHLPQTVRLVIISRSEPPLPLARLRVRGQLAELRATDLRFSPAETATFLR
ncbi:MAG: helix-turn-helix transcriptional regulator, partial [Oscillochloris sp.]|nr:helix-turn-helix transcriptional regulator [Oscillochloris sp.]